MGENERVAPVLAIRDLSCTLSRRAILQGVSFSVEAGEYLSLVGPNGAGKSTLLRCLVRLLAVSEKSEILLAGKRLESLSQREIARRIAYIPQALPQSFAFTVRHFVQMGRYAYQTRWGALTAEDEAICRDAMAQTGIEALENRAVDTLSGGELQCVALAAALAQEAEILMLDETFSQLDYRFRQRFADLLCQLNRAGKTILLVSHDLNYAAMDAQRILALAEGRVVYDGVPAEFLCAETLQKIYRVPFSLIQTAENSLPVVVPHRHV